jgi:hypothetical protein
LCAQFGPHPHEIYEARIIRDAEKADPGIVRRASVLMIPLQLSLAPIYSLPRRLGFNPLPLLFGRLLDDLDVAASETLKAVAS